jgi:hypothetical protein
MNCADAARLAIEELAAGPLLGLGRLKQNPAA